MTPRNKRQNSRVNPMVINTFNGCIEGGMKKTEAYNAVADMYDMSVATVRRILAEQNAEQNGKNAEQNGKNAEQNAEQNGKNAEQNGKNAEQNAEQKHFSSADIVQHICKLGKSDDYVEAFSKLQKQGKILNEGVKLSNGTMLLF